MEITGYKQIDLIANTPKEYTLKNAKKVVIANMTPGDITITFLDTSETIILTGYKTLEKDDLYNVSTRIKLSSATNKRIELVVNGDLRINTPITTSGGTGSGGSYDDTAVKQAIQINTDNITENSRKIGVIETQTQTNQNTISNVNNKVNINSTQIGELTTKVNDTKTNVTNLSTTVTTNTNTINNMTPKLAQIETNKNDIVTLKRSLPANNGEDLSPMVESQTYQNPTFSNGEYVLGDWTSNELLQIRYSITLSANNTLRLPQLSDDLSGDPPNPPNYPLRVPDKDKNNFIEVLLNITSELTLRYHDGGTFNQSILLKPGKYQFIANYNPLARASSWDVNIYNLANTIDVYTPTISTGDPDNNDGKPNGAVWYKI